MTTKRAGIFMTAVLSGALALACGVGAGTAHADQPEAVVKQACDAEKGTYSFSVEPDGTRNSTCATYNESLQESCQFEYKNGERWATSCSRTGPEGPPPGAPPTGM
jgi:hypothetical protein